MVPNVIDDATAEAFLTERENLLKRLDPQERSVARELQMALPHWRGSASGLGKKFINLEAAAFQRFERSRLYDINKLLVVDLALGLPEKLAERDLPGELLAMYQPATKRLLTYLQEASDPQYYYPHDFFVKDLRVASGLSVPSFGAQDIDLRSAIGYRASARGFLRKPAPEYIGSMLRHGQIVPWFRIHTDTRRRADFNEPEFDACYRQIAALLRRHPAVLGMTATSWLYDPQLESVSPRLSFVRSRPVEHGAFLVWSGSSASDVQNATAASDTRRRLYREGKYIPVSYTVLWPRQKLLAWA